MLILEALIIRAMRALDGLRWRIRQRRDRQTELDRLRRAGHEGTHGEWWR